MDWLGNRRLTRRVPVARRVPTSTSRAHRVRQTVVFRDERAPAPVAQPRNRPVELRAARIRGWSTRHRRYPNCNPPARYVTRPFTPRPCS